MPFVLVQAKSDATVDVHVSNDMQDVQLDFHNAMFQIHDDAYVAKLLAGEDIQQQQAMCPGMGGGLRGFDTADSFAHFLEQAHRLDLSQQHSMSSLQGAAAAPPAPPGQHGQSLPPSVSQAQQMGRGLLRSGDAGHCMALKGRSGGPEGLSGMELDAGFHDLLYNPQSAPPAQQVSPPAATAIGGRGGSRGRARAVRRTRS